MPHSSDHLSKMYKRTAVKTVKPIKELLERWNGMMQNDGGSGIIIEYVILTAFVSLFMVYAVFLWCLPPTHPSFSLSLLNFLSFLTLFLPLPFLFLSSSLPHSYSPNLLLCCSFPSTYFCFISIQIFISRDLYTLVHSPPSQL